MVKKLAPQVLKNLALHLPRAVLANLKYGFPGKRIKIIGVTGTDGKTTTVNMIFQILKQSGKKVSMVSTINAEIAGRKYDTGFHVTTPSSEDIQYYISKALKNGDEYMVLEITSHSLDQFRVWGIPIEVGVITNITHEHLDYHKTFENYVKAKAKLIKHAQFAILNYDDPSFNKLKQTTSGKVTSFGLKRTADFNPINFPLKLRMLGEYNMYNALAAAAVGTTLGIEKNIIQDTLEEFTSLEGRMEEIENNLGIKIIVDFAHTPNALENALKSIRKVTPGKLISVFGCAAERDVAKRPLMGEVSAKYADITILTNEDPRFEDQMKIITQIARGAYKQGAIENETLFYQPDRQQAIIKAIKLAKKGDSIGIFGKGHEKSMNYQGVEKDWSDQRAVKMALKNGR